ncbi:MCE family protein [bacterium]|nr:MCE family protein [bacterium]
MDKSKDIHKYVWIEFGIWFIILLVLVFGIKLYNYKNSEKLTTYQIFLPDVDGLVVGSPVRYLGVQIGYIDKIKIVYDEVYIKLIITDKDLKLPKGVIATVEFNGMGGSKSLEIYPPTKESIASGKIMAVSKPVRLNDAIALMDHMFDKIDSIASRFSFFAKETGMTDIENAGLNFDKIDENIEKTNQFIKLFKRNQDNP